MMVNVSRYFAFVNQPTCLEIYPHSWDLEQRKQQITSKRYNRTPTLTNTV